MVNMAVLLHLIIAFFILETGIAHSILDESKCSKFDYEYRVLERIIFLENKNAEMETRQAALERKNEELMETVIKQRLVIEAKDKELEQKDRELEENDQKLELLNEIWWSNKTVGFTVGLDGNKKYSGGQTVVFHNVVSNLGGGYNPATGVFTVPEDGLYLFSITVMTWEKIVTVQITLNNQEITKVYANGRSGSATNDSSSNIVIVNATKGDDVHVRFVSSAGPWQYDLQGVNWCTFSGVLIH